MTGCFSFLFNPALLHRKKQIFLSDERPYHIVDQSKISRTPDLFLNEDNTGPDWLQSVEHPRSKEDVGKRPNETSSSAAKSTTNGAGEIQNLKTHLPDLTALNGRGRSSVHNSGEDVADNDSGNASKLKGEIMLIRCQSFCHKYYVGGFNTTK